MQFPTHLCRSWQVFSDTKRQAVHLCDSWGLVIAGYLCRMVSLVMQSRDTCLVSRRRRLEICFFFMPQSWLSLDALCLALGLCLNFHVSSCLSLTTTYITSVLATSAPVACAFSQTGSFLHSHRVRISDNLLRHLMLAKCNRRLMWHCTTVMCLDKRLCLRKKHLASNTVYRIVLYLDHLLCSRLNSQLMAQPVVGCSARTQQVQGVNKLLMILSRQRAKSRVIDVVVRQRRHVTRYVLTALVPRLRRWPDHRYVVLRVLQHLK